MPYMLIWLKILLCKTMIEFRHVAYMITSAHPEQHII
jgi:hypothetical protein